MAGEWDVVDEIPGNQGGGVDPWAVEDEWEVVGEQGGTQPGLSLGQRLGLQLSRGLVSIADTVMAPNRAARSVIENPRGALQFSGDIVRSIADAPTYTKGAIGAALEEENPFAREDWRDRWRAESSELAARRAREVQERENLYDSFLGIDPVQARAGTGQSLGFSGVAAGAGLAAGLPVAAAGGPLSAPAAWTAGALASGTAAHNMARVHFLDNAVASLEQALAEEGVTMSQADKVRAAEELADYANQYGLWEAIPEAVGNVAGLKIILAPMKSAFGKVFGDKLAERALTKFAATYGVELATETITQTGQHNVEVAAGLSDKAPRSWTSPEDLGESMREVAGPTLINTALMTGTVGVGGKAIDLLRNGRQTSEDPPQPQQTGAPSEWDVVGFLTPEEEEYFRNADFSNLGLRPEQRRFGLLPEPFMAVSPEGVAGRPDDVAADMARRQQERERAGSLGPDYIQDAARRVKMEEQTGRAHLPEAEPAPYGLDMSGRPRSEPLGLPPSPYFVTPDGVAGRVREIADELAQRAEFRGLSREYIEDAARRVAEEEAARARGEINSARLPEAAPEQPQQDDGWAPKRIEQAPATMSPVTQDQGAGDKLTEQTPLQPESERDELNRWFGDSKVVDVDPRDLEYRENEQNRIDEVEQRFPEKIDNPIVAIVGGDKPVILDGHNRASVAAKRGTTVPAVAITKEEYSSLSGMGFDDTEIAYAALVRAGQEDAASDLSKQFPGSGVTRRGMQAWQELPDVPEQIKRDQSPEPSRRDQGAGTSQEAAPVKREPIARRELQEADDTAVTATGRNVPVKYAVVEAEDLVASQLDDMRDNPAYPAELQPRDRSRATSVQQIQDIANNLNPRLLDRSPRASDGAPIISDDGIVESGNGRVLGVRLAYKKGTAEKYKQYLADQGYPIEGMRQPVLVRIRQGEMSPEDRKAFTREANERDNLGMSATERAMSDAAALPNELLDMYEGGDVDSAANRPFVRAFIARVVSANDRAGMVTPEGTMSQDAIRRIEAALLAKAYDDAELVRSLIESADTNIRAIGGALMDVAGQWSQMRASASEGRIDPSMDQTDRLLDAVRLVQRSRREGRSLSEFVGQVDLLTGAGINPVTEAFLRLMYRNTQNWTQPFGREKLGDGLRFYLSAAEKALPGIDLLGQSAPPPGQILSAAREGIDDGARQRPQQDIFTQPAGGAGDGARASGADRAEQGAEGGTTTPGEEGARAGQQGTASEEVTPSPDVAPGDTSAEPVAETTEGEQVIPVFETYQEAHKWLTDLARSRGMSLQQFSTTDEYRAIHPQLDALYKADREKRGAGRLQQMKEAGISVGDQVETTLIGPFMNAERYTGRIVLKGGMPYVKIDGRITVSRNGKIRDTSQIVWDPRWKKIGGGQQEADSGIDAAAAKADTDPTEAQKEAGNYRKGHIRLHGLDISIENPRGSERSGVDRNGKPWTSTMAHHYGYIRRTEGKDGDHIDVFLGPDAENADLPVFVIDQVNPETGRFDEHKVMIGFPNEAAARVGYRSNYAKDWKGLGSITQASMDEFKAWLRDGDTTKPFAKVEKTGAAQQDQAEAANKALRDAAAKAKAAPRQRQTAAGGKAKPKKIEDAGEKLGGARKDELRDVRVRLENMDDQAIAESTLSQLWPKEEIDKIEDKFEAAMYYAVRSMVPAKPRTSWKVKRWVEQVKEARAMLQVLDEVRKDRLGTEGLMDALRDYNYATGIFADHVEVLVAIDRKDWGRIEKIERSNGGKYIDGKWVDIKYVTVNIDGKRQIFADRSDVKSAIADIKEALSKNKPKDEGLKFSVFWDLRRGEYFIAKTGDKEKHRLKTFASSKEAEDFLKNNKDELVALWDAVKNRINVTKADVRGEENAKRIGRDWRNGRDISPQEFIDTFGFRGVEFGNWVGQGRGENERQGLLNEAYDAFMDLSDLLGLPPGAMSLEGTLGIGLGSRGRGWASAHYEPDQIVINLTKTRGAGSLAHEWFHALDNYFQRKRKEDVGKSRSSMYITYNPETYYIEKHSKMRIPESEFIPMSKGEKSPSGRRFIMSRFRPEDWTRVEGVRPEVAKEFAELVKTLNQSPMSKRAAAIDKNKEDGYWSRIIERAARSFETYVIARLADRGYRNDFLANVVSLENFKRDPHRYPYLTPDEQGPVNEAFDRLFSTIETKEAERGIAMFSRSLKPSDDEVTAGLKLLAEFDDIFLLPASDKVHIRAIAEDIDPAFTVEDVRNVPPAHANGRPGRRWEITTPDGMTATITENDREVWIDASMLNAGKSRGIALYQIAAVYAKNNGKVFIGDPAGLSDIALRRRTDNMLSLALKYGNTDFMLPHPRQVEGDASIGVKPLKWKIGDDVHNLRELAKSSYHNAVFMYPELENVEYDFESETFRDRRTGEPFTDEDFARLVREVQDSARAAAPIGSATAKRIAVIGSLLRSKGSEVWRRILASISSKLHAGEPYRGLGRIFYSRRGGIASARPDDGGGSGRDSQGGDGIPPSLARNAKIKQGTRPLAGFSVSAVQEFVDAIAANWRNAPRIHVIPDMSKAPDRIQQQDREERERGAVGEPEGFYYEGEVYLVLHSISPERGESFEAAVFRVLMHEVLGHAGLRGLFGDELNTFLRQIVLLRRKDVEAKAKERKLDPKKPEDLLHAAEEVLADMAQEAPALGLVQKAIEAIRRALRKLYLRLPNSIKERLGGSRFVEWINALTDAEIIRDYIEPARRFIQEGERAASIGERPAFSRSKAGIPETVLVDGVQRPTRNSNVQLIHPTIEGIRNFWRWFGDSKVVDDEGRPLVVYHGTGSEFSIFSEDLADEAGVAGKGFYFTSSGDEASSYAERGDTPNVIAAYVSISNPLVILAGRLSDGRSAIDVHRQYAPVTNKKGADEIRSIAEQNNNDGVVWLGNDGSVRHVVAFRPEQIKSATGNRGTFDPENPDIRFSRAARKAGQTQQAAPQQQGQPKQGAPTGQKGTGGTGGNNPPPPVFGPGGFTVPEGSRLWEELVFKAIDRFNYLAKVQRAAAKKRRLSELPESEDAYLAEMRYHGQAGAAIEDFQREHVDPLLKIMSDNGITVEEVDRYLHARHAPEANAHLKSINPGLPNNDALSGMSDADAAQIMQDVQNSGKARVFAEIARRVDAITKARRDLLVSSGLEKRQTIQAWESTYQHYVPLHREGKGTEAPPKGKGFSITGRDKRRAGSNRAVVNVLANVVADYEATVIQAEKAKVGRALLEFAQNNPNPDLYEVDKVEYAPRFNSAGLVTYAIQPGYTLADNVLVVRVNGEDHTITFNEQSHDAMRIARAMKNLGADDAGVVLKYLHKLTRFLAMMNTSLNPEFVISNFFRDIQTAGYNLQDTDARRMTREIIRDVGKAWRGIRAFQNGKHHPWAQHFDEFRKAGAQTGWIDHYRDVKEREDRLKDRIKHFQKGGAFAVQRGLGAVVEFIEAENTAVENAIRLSAFVHARRAGLSEGKAAALAKNLTVNFNKRGDAGMMLNSLYMFYNASVQGSVRLLKALRHRRVQDLVLGTVVAAAVLDMLNRAMGGDDDDGKPRYDKIPDYIKERNLIIMLPGERGDYAKIPLPWGYNVFHVIGQEIGSAFTKTGYDPAESALRVAASAAEAFNPVQSATILQMLSPTATDPLVMWSENKNWYGGKLRPDDNPFGPETPESQKYFNSVREPSKWVAAKLNELTGGDEVRPGMIDISPAAIDLLIDTVTGGAGRFVADTFGTPIKALSGEEVESGDIPLIRKLYGKPGTSDVQREFYQNMDAVRSIEHWHKEYRRRGEHEKAAKLRQEYDAEFRMIGRYKQVEQAMSKLRQAEKAYQRRGDEAGVRRMKEKQREIMQKFNAAYYERVTAAD